MSTNSFASSSMALQAGFTRVFRAFGGRGASAAEPSATSEVDCFDDDADEPAIAGEDLTTARDRGCRANYPLGVTG